MEHFVTYFNYNYLPFGLNLFHSIKLHQREFKLWVVCLDLKTHETLRTLNYPEIELIKLSDIETPELLKIKSERKIHEYFWTLTPFIPAFVLSKNPKISRICYLDADMWLRKSLDEIFDQFDEEKSTALITKHAFAPLHDASRTAGIFCVQCLIFSQNALNKILPDWQNDCLDWCFDFYFEDKFGDQKYLEKWSKKYSGVSILKKQELILGPWNFERFPYSDAAIIHFHSFKIKKYTGTSLFYHMSDYYVPQVVEEEIYSRYAQEMKLNLKKLYNINYKIKNENYYVDILKHSYRIVRNVILVTMRRFKVWSKV